MDFDDAAAREAVEAISLFTREKMWALHHIPLRYYIPPEDRDWQEQEFEQLQTELHQHGRILLDYTGTPACLTGKRPVLGSPDLHGPWRDEEKR